MGEERPPDTRATAETEASYRFWQSRTPAEGFAETWRLSVEHYGMPIGDLRDGPVMKYPRLPNDVLWILSETCGPNPVRYTAPIQG